MQHLTRIRGALLVAVGRRVLFVLCVAGSGCAESTSQQERADPAVASVATPSQARPDHDEEAPVATDWQEHSIESLQQAMAQGELSAVALVDRYIDRIERYDRTGHALNAIASLDPGARAQAAALDAERRSQGPRSLLHGIPVLVKDNYETRGMPTTAGSVQLANYAPQRDAHAVQALREAGAVILGKTNMHEYAYGITTVGSGFGATKNAYHPGRNPGGSSGGTGAAIAAGLRGGWNGQRHLRVDPHPGGTEQPVRSARHSGTEQPSRHHSAVQHPGYRRSPGALCPRPRHRAGCHGWVRCTRSANPGHAGA